MAVADCTIIRPRSMGDVGEFAIVWPRVIGCRHKHRKQRVKRLLGHAAAVQPCGSVAVVCGIRAPAYSAMTLSAIVA